jgi:hypothetical protein
VNLRRAGDPASTLTITIAGVMPTFAAQFLGDFNSNTRMREGLLA